MWHATEHLLAGNQSEQLDALIKIDEIFFSVCLRMNENAGRSADRTDFPFFSRECKENAGSGDEKKFSDFPASVVVRTSSRLV